MFEEPQPTETKPIENKPTKTNSVENKPTEASNLENKVNEMPKTGVDSVGAGLISSLMSFVSILFIKRKRK